jgi:uncharacterized protein YndB with AHSA1/START domain
MAGPGERLEFRRTIAASRERIYRAWTEAEGLKRWLAPGEAGVSRAEADAVVGGAWSVTMRGPGGEEWVVGGVFEALEPPARLVLTWRWAHEPVESTSTVRVTLREVPGGTDLLLEHEGLSGSSRGGHGEAWMSCLEKLAAESRGEAVV